MALALEKMIAPAIGAPARPFTEQTGSKLDVSVVFTSVDATLTALKEAANLASSLDGRITLIVPQIVPYPLPLASPPVLVDFNERRLRVIASNCRVETRVSIYLCRDPLETLRSVLKPHSLVVVGSRKRWWPTAEERLAKKLRHFGHQVVVTERE
ncbi:MAG TPA: hypothetical protein VK708_17240 [Bryobacteraceae bacterium]|nr:hypothetical protein [Bryobacteraceae bacterium]